MTTHTEASESAISTQAQHTPGPWSLADDGEVYSEPVYRSICMVLRFGGLQVGEWRANARLIATAPELLVALGRLLNDSMYKDHPEASQMAIDAIAKATQP